MAVEPASKRQRISGVEGEYTMTLSLTGGISFDGQAVGELLVDLKSRVLTLEERAKAAEQRAEQAEAELAKKATTESVEASFSTLSENKSDKVTCSGQTDKLEEKKADKADVVDRVGLLEAELAKLKETMALHAKVMEAELEKQRLEAFERQKVEEADKQRLAEIERQKAEELEKERLAELERQRASQLEAQRLEELEKQKTTELERQQAEAAAKQKAAELDQQKSADLAQQQAAEEKRKAADAQAQAQAQAAAATQATAAQAAQAAAAAAAQAQAAAAGAAAAQRLLQRNDSAVDASLAQKSGAEFLKAQVANLSETAKQAHKEIEVALKEDIEFTPSSSTLTTKGKKIVQKVSEVLKKHPTMIINVEGHTGCRCIAGGGPPKRGGPKCKAVELSNDRAASVMEHLRTLGRTNSLKSKGHGCIFRVGMAVKVFPAAGQ